MTLNPDLIARIVGPICSREERAREIAAAIVQAHEIAAQIARLDRDQAAHADECSRQRTAIAAERRAVQERCGHPVTVFHAGGPGPEESYRTCGVCGGEVGG